MSLPFRAGTVSWDVLRRPVFLLGGMRALLLQISEPGIAAGVAEHSDFTNRVFDRMRDTVELIVEVGLGDPTEAQRAVMEMNRAHRGVRGKMPDGSTYDAAQPELRLWVLTTLIDTVLVVEATYVGEFREEERARYYRESLEIARVLEVADPPQTLDEFHRYMTERFDSLTITDHARQIAHHVLYPDLGWTPQWSLAPIRAITADLLPARLREGYGLSLSPRQARWLRRFQALSRATLPRMPDWIRTYPLLRPIAGLKDRISHSRNQEE
ncbi:MAG TPA: oxygenase MpaB family protein [Acidimicrobiia bacterium]